MTLLTIKFDAADGVGWLVLNRPECIDVALPDTNSAAEKTYGHH